MDGSRKKDETHNERERILKGGMKMVYNKDNEILKWKEVRDSKKRRKRKTGNEERSILKCFVNSLKMSVEKHAAIQHTCFWTALFLILHISSVVKLPLLHTQTCNCKNRDITGTARFRKLICPLFRFISTVPKHTGIKNCGSQCDLLLVPQTHYLVREFLLKKIGWNFSLMLSTGYVIKAGSERS